MGTVTSGTTSMSGAAIAFVVIVILLLLIIIAGLVAFILYGRIKEKKQFDYQFVRFKEGGNEMKESQQQEIAQQDDLQI